MKRKIIILLLLIIAVLLPSCTQNDVILTEEDMEFINKYYIEYESELFDAENITLTFAAMSDVHIGGKNQDVKLGKAIDILNRRAKNGLDAILFAGDLTDTTGAKSEDAQIKVFKEVIDKNKKKDTSLLYVLGNHDQNGEKTTGEMFFNVFGKTLYDADINSDEEILAGKRHWIVNGYHFLGIDFDWDDQHQTGDNVTWLDAKLKEITEKEPEKPVFFTVHVPPASNLDKVLSKYPQVICLSGHTHLPMNSDRGIIQSNYTFLRCGGMYYYRQYTISGKTIEDLGEKYNFMQGLLIDVDKNHNVRVIRMDFHNIRSYEPDWIIPAPKEDKSHLLYTYDLKDKSNRPYFVDETIDFSESMTYTLIGKFKAAKTENINPIEYYEVTLWQEEGVETKNISTYYAIVNEEDFPEQFEFRFIRVDADAHAVSITAYDCHGCSSNNLLYNKGLYFVDIRSNIPGKANIKAYKQGEKVTLKITPPSGYRMENITAEGIELNDSMSFTMPDNNVIINVTYSRR